MGDKVLPHVEVFKCVGNENKTTWVIDRWIGAVLSKERHLGLAGITFRDSWVLEVENQDSMYMLCLCCKSSHGQGSHMSWKTLKMIDQFLQENLSWKIGKKSYMNKKHLTGMREKRVKHFMHEYLFSAAFNGLYWAVAFVCF